MNVNHINNDSEDIRLREIREHRVECELGGY